MEHRERKCYLREFHAPTQYIDRGILVLRSNTIAQQALQKEIRAQQQILNALMFAAETNATITMETDL